MKNISRRVFIKGMAVAAVATAASTVLTGCKLPVGPEEPEVVPTPANTVTYTVDDGSLTVASPKMEVTGHADNSTEGIVFNFDITNNMGQGKTVQVLKAAPTANFDDYNYYVVVEKVSLYDKNNVKLENFTDTDYTATGLADNIGATNGVTLINGVTKSGIVAIQTGASAAKDQWVKAEVELKIYETIEDSTGKVYAISPKKTATFTYSK